jgi:hypothetical protein
VHCDRVAPGARQTKFTDVGQLHQKKYIELISKQNTDFYEDVTRWGQSKIYSDPRLLEKAINRKRERIYLLGLKNEKRHAYVC